MSLLELADNLFQMIVFGVVVAFSNVLAIKKPTFVLMQYFAGGMACIFAGTLFWTIYFVIYGEFPYYFSAADLCYLCFFLFFIGLCKKYFKENMANQPTLSNRMTAMIFSILVIAINTVCYLLVGGLFYNVFYALPLAFLAYFASLNMLILRGRPDFKHTFYFHVVLMFYILFNNLMFLFSSLMLNTVYLFFDFLMTLTFPVMLFLLKKEAQI
jgi:hypothetical protein